MTVEEARRRQLWTSLSATIGDVQADTLMTMLPAQPLPELATREDMAALRAEIRAEGNAVRAELGNDIAGLWAAWGELRGEFGDLRAEFGDLRAEFGELRGEFSDLKGDLRSEMSELRAQLTSQMFRLTVALVSLMVAFNGAILTLGLSGAFA